MLAFYCILSVKAIKSREYIFFINLVIFLKEFLFNFDQYYCPYVFFTTKLNKCKYFIFY